MDITKICYDVGYNSYTHFFSNFTKIIGETPYTYRKNNFDMSNQEEAQKRISGSSRSYRDKTPYTYRKNNFDMSNQEEAQKRISGSSRSYRDKSVGFANIKHHS